jgi:ATP adenylyltransferase
MPEKQSRIREILALQSGTLWTIIKEQTQHALASGALQPIPTECEFVEQEGIRFLVRILSNLVRKDEAKQKEKKSTSGKEFNPFLPYEENLFVTDISETHLCLLNKFNVVDYHLLIITRAFEEQESLLTQLDFEAMWACLAEIDGLVFYNAGKAAGASQRHKHLQLIPLPLDQEGLKIPIEAVVAKAEFSGSVGTISHFPFKHGLVRFDASWVKSPLEAAAATLESYYTLLESLDLQKDIEVSDIKQSHPYNLLVTREWMLMIPRSQECFESISVNSLGFAGALLVRNQQQMELLKNYHPITILKEVAIPTAEI